MGVFAIKKSFVLVLTLFLLSIFSFLLIFIFQTKSLQNKNIKNQYLYIQANNHKEFLKDYIKSIDLKDIKKIQIKDKTFTIEAFIKKSKVHIFIKAKNYDVNVHSSFTK